jgi:hypothetical protein
MKKIFLALGVCAYLAGAQAYAGEIVNFTEVKPTVNDDGKSVIVLPDKKKTSRRRMLFDFGLFGAGLHVGWMKPKNLDVVETSQPATTSGAATGNGGGDGDKVIEKTIEIKRHKHRIGTPIFNVSAGKFAVGLGTH